MWLDFFMVLVTFDVYGAEWPCGAYVFAGSAADASLLVDGRDSSIWILWAFYHRDGAIGAVAGAIAARDIVRIDYAPVGHPHGVAYLRRDLQVN